MVDLLAPASFAAAALGAIVLLSPKTATADPSPWSDSERTGDLVFFGVYGGVSFAEVGTLSHTLNSGGQAVIHHIKAPVSFAAGYQMAFWPYDFFGLDIATEFFGLPLTPKASYFESSPTYSLRTVPYEGVGAEWAPTLRFGIPLYFMQPNIGGGLVFPATFISTEDPKTRLREPGIDPGVAARATGGINVYVSKRFRLYAEYHFDYTLATVAPGNPLDVRGFLRHSVVLGFLSSPESYRKDPKAEKLTAILVPTAIPAVLYAIMACVKAAVPNGAK